jgi:Leucine-rich repeat (LRR) protein
MLKKIVDLFSGEKGKKETENSTPVQPAPDISRYIQCVENRLSITDYNNELTTLPDDFFESYLQVQSVEMKAQGLINIPSSISCLQQIKHLDFSGGKFRTFPDLSTLKSLESLSISGNNLLDLNKELEKLEQLPFLRKVCIGSYRGNVFPKSILFLKNCTQLELGSQLEKKFTFPELFGLIAQMPWLKKLKIGFYVRHHDFPEEILKLDFLDELSMNVYAQENTIPSLFGLLRHVNFEERSALNKAVAPFRERYKQQEMPDHLRKLLFCFHIKNFKELKTILPDNLAEAFQRKEKRGIVLLTKIKGLTQKALNEKFSATTFYLAKSEDSGPLLYVVGTDTEFGVIESLVLQGKTLVFQDYLQELIIKLDDPWLLQKDNTDLNVQLLQLLASNQVDNYKVAFEIIAGGGANKTVQALLAAIMLSHPDKVVAKGAERLYDQYGSALFKEHCRQNSSCSLRKSGNTARKLSVLLKHPDIEEFVFRFMHHAIASANPNIKDVQPHCFEAKNSQVENLPEVIRYFGTIECLDFSACPNLNLTTSIPWLKQMTGLKQLWINGSHIVIPAIIEQVTQLEVLEADYNDFEDISVLTSLTNLRQLNIEGCKIKSFEWLVHLQKLNQLNINNNNLTHVPTEVHQLKELNMLTLKQNKLGEMDQGLLNLTKLRHIDFSNNVIETIDYRYFGTMLEVLLLRSNKIEDFVWEKIKEMKIEPAFIEKLNLAGNRLRKFSLGNLRFSKLNVLDISNNKIEELHSSVFECTNLRELYASKNQITDVPDNISVRSYYTKVWLQDNQIKELRESFSKIQIDNCDLSDNQISKLHPNFEIKKEKDYSRLYWKMRNNPVAKELKGVAGLYGH